MRKLLVLCSFWLCVATLGAQNAERKLYSVAFYNLENLFDTIHDAGKNDYEFLPDGSYQWTAKKYESKLQNLSKVLGSLSRDLVPEGPAFIGVAEAENSRGLEDRPFPIMSSCIMKDRTDGASTVPCCTTRSSSALPTQSWCFLLLLRGIRCT